MREIKGVTVGKDDLLLNAVIKGLQEKKGEEILVMDLRTSRNSVADFFVLATGNSKIHVEALTESVDEFVRKELGEHPWHIEGLTNGQWVLIDYVNVVVHVFQANTRAFYNLEGLWADANFKHINEPY